MKQLILSEIWTYPVKSLGGIRLNRARIFEKGLELDRRWMLVDERGMFMTQRVFPKMALFKLALNGENVVITYQDPEAKSINNPSITIQTAAPALGENFQANLWDDVVHVVEVDQQISDWFSELLMIRCRFVHFPENHARRVDQRYQVNGEHVSLADAYPFLIIGQSSLNDLNHRLEHPVPMNRFRPNFVFTGGEAYEEDKWRNFKIGNNRFVGVKPCARCTLTTVDQTTARKGSEPLATLSGYRKVENKVLFGQNVVAVDHGVINAGDPIELN